jgi:hypothetical protein
MFLLTVPSHRFLAFASYDMITNQAIVTVNVFRFFKVVFDLILQLFLSTSFSSSSDISGDGCVVIFSLPLVPRLAVPKQQYPRIRTAVLVLHRSFKCIISQLYTSSKRLSITSSKSSLEVGDLLPK